MTRLLGRRPVLIGSALVIVLIAGALLMGFGGQSKNHFTVYFAQVKGLYVGDSVDVLGVPVGKVTSIKAEPGRVVVDIEVDGDRPIPADAKAVLVAPSLVSVRRVSLAPAYGGGAKLADGATIPMARTAVPVEWDDVKEQLTRLSAALGPKGANKEGALGRIVQGTADNLKGEGANLNKTLSQLSEAMTTLADSKGDIFSTVRNLQVIVTALEASDTQVYQFNDRLTSVAGLLADDRNDLAAALDGVEQVFVKLQRFVKENRADLKDTVAGLGRATQLLADNRQGLADILQVAPTTVSNFYNIYDPYVPALTGSVALENFDSPATFLCSAVYSLGRSPETCAQLLAPVAKFLRIGSPPIGLSLITRNGRDPDKSSDPGGVNPKVSTNSSSDADLIAQLQQLLNGGKKP